MTSDRTHFLFLNVGHFFDHLFVLIFATVAALVLAAEWSMSYAELIPYATPGFVAFGVFALPAGWLADKWSRPGMMAVFFIGAGASALLTAFAHTPLQIGAGLSLIGVFAAIYHPVGIAMIVQGRTRTGVPIAVNGVFGNMGVACAALLTGWLIDVAGWRAAFALPGALAVAIGLGYIAFIRRRTEAPDVTRAAVPATVASAPDAALALKRGTLIRIFGIIFFSTAVGGLVFQSTTFALPKVFAERLTDLADTATLIGGYAFVVFAIAGLAQLMVGYLIDRYSLRTVFACVAGLQVLAFATMQELTGVAALLVATAFMLVVFGQIPINDVLLGRIARSEWRSRAYALRYVVTFSVMASAVPLIAWFHAHWGFAALFNAMALAAACTLVAVLMLPRAATAARTAPLGAD